MLLVPNMSLAKIDAQLKAMGLNKKDKNTIINMGPGIWGECCFSGITTGFSPFELLNY